MEKESPKAKGSMTRNRAIRLAVLTSILSKCGTMLLRLVSIPVAIKALGMEEFGVYATITMVVGMLDMMHVGIGPALTRGIAQAVAKGDRDREQGFFATAILMSAGLTALAATILGILVVVLPVTVLFGEAYAPFSESMKHACGIALVIIATEMVCIVMERARDGYLETRFNNAWGAAGNFVGASVLFVGVRYFPTIEFLLLAVNGSIASAKLFNAIHLLVSRPYLFPKIERFKGALVKPLVFDGARFSVTYLMSALIEYNMIAYLIGRLSGPHAVGMYQIMVTVHFSTTGLVQMFTIPLWPAIVDAHSRGDVGWVRAAGRRIRLLGPACGLAATAGMVILGPWIFPLWVGEEFSLGRSALAAFGAYFTLHLWRHVNQVLLLGIGDVSFAVRVVVLESLVVLSAVAFGLTHGMTLFGVYLTIAICLAVISTWVYPLRFRRQMQTWSGDLDRANEVTVEKKCGGFRCDPVSSPIQPSLIGKSGN